MQVDDLIIEIGTEELPPKSLNQLSFAFLENFKIQLQKQKLNFENIKCFASPRRIAVLIEKLHKTEKIPEIFSKVIRLLPLPKKMRWGEGECIFIRPVHWVLALYGEKVIDLELFGIKSENKTYGHRFLAPGAIRLSNPREYEYKLKELGKVIVDFAARKKLIIEELNINAKNLKVTVEIDEELLEIVTNMVEYPKALVAHFSSDFLKLPPECLISAMKHHQKSFHLLNEKKELQAGFIFINNMPINDPTKIIAGNKRVMQARLQDAVFLYNQDLKSNFNQNIEKLKTVVLQQQLGSIYDQTLRLENIAINISKLLQENKSVDVIKKAALLAKADLVSKMVIEFPELQGIMGYHYARKAGETEDVALAIKEHYLPRFAEDRLPESTYGICLALAYRLDLLFGLFAIGKAPTGEKDPFGLRRHALGMIRILIEKKRSINLLTLFEITKNAYHDQLKFDHKILLDFCLERLKNWYLSQNIASKFFSSIKDHYDLYDFDLRIKAVLEFSLLPEADNLAQANKRVHNLLVKNFSGNTNINPELFEINEEYKLFEQIKNQQAIIKPILQQKNYGLVLKTLVNLSPFIDQFFQKVMVMVECENLKQNRLALLFEVRELFLQVADISCL